MNRNEHHIQSTPLNWVKNALDGCDPIKRSQLYWNNDCVDEYLPRGKRIT